MDRISTVGNIFDVPIAYGTRTQEAISGIRRTV